MTNRQRVHGLAHLASTPLRTVELHLYQYIDETLLRGMRDGRVGADDGFAGDGISETQHEVFAYWQAEGLSVVFEAKGEEAGIG